VAAFSSVLCVQSEMNRWYREREGFKRVCGGRRRRSEGL